MKHCLTLLICFFLLSSFSFSQPIFISHILTVGGYPKKPSLCDMDNDGDLDILVFAGGDQKVVWYRNNGNGFYDTAIVINSNNELVYNAEPADLDQDGDIDVVCCASGRICWFENAGNGSFGSCQNIYNNYAFDGNALLYINDLDNDNFKDIICSTYSDSTITWFRNLGNGNFGPQQIIDTISATSYKLIPVDLDQDGKKDLLCSKSFHTSSITYSINTWKKNLGNGNFSLEQFIDSVEYSYGGIEIVDFDNNGFPDIVGSHGFVITWKKNLGGGNFSNDILIDSTSATPRLALADMDGDSDMDMISTYISTYFVVWQENIGGGVFGPSQMICDTLPNLAWSCSGDLDNDGDIDIVSSTSIHSTIEVFKNSGANIYSHFQRISYAAASAMDVHISDIDNDGLPDILSASRADDKIAWYKNLGNKQFSLQKEISTSVTYANSVSTADFDLDGHEDVVAGGWGNEVVWFHDFHNDFFGSCDTIPYSYGNTFRIVTCDMDNDSLIDVIWNSGGALHLSKNLGSGNFGNPQFLNNILDIDAIAVKDLNNDSLPDIVVSNESRIFLIGNNGGGNFVPLDTINPFIGGQEIDLVDIDNDNDIDIVFQDFNFWTYPLENFLGYYPNDGFGNFDSIVFIPCAGDMMSYGMATVDIDNDGDLDIFSGLLLSSTFDNRLIWYENLGSANFGPPIPVDFIENNVWDICTSDLDNDGDMDLILALHPKVQWLENTLNNLVDTITICADDSAMIFGNWVSQPGDYTDTLINIQGGDSVIIVRLENFPTYFPLDTIEICEGEAYNFYGQMLTTTGIYSETFQSVHGCDSIEELTLVVIPAPVVSISPFVPDSVSIDSGLLALPAATPAGGIYSGNGIVANAFYPSIAGLGEHWILYTYSDSLNGCSNTDSTLIKVYDPIGIYELEKQNVKLYPNPGTGDFVLTGTNLQSVHIKTLTGRLVKEVTINNRNEVHFNLAGQTKGIYFVHIENDDTKIRKLLVLM